MRLLCLALLAGLSPLAAQTAFVTGSGYVAPPAIYVAPGQVTTFYAGGLSQTGVSATLSVGDLSQTVPVLSVKPVDSSTLAITVLIPFSLVPGTASVTIQFAGSDGTMTAPVSLNVAPILPHIITTCDTLYPTPTSPCELAITHQDGSLVTNSAPATGGEILSIWAVGLGVPSTGIPVAGSGPIAMDDIILNTGFLVTSAQGTLFSSSQTPYLYAGLTSPAGGLYQINFAVPQPPAGLVSCATSSQLFSMSGNLNVSVFRELRYGQVNPVGTVSSGFFAFSAIGSASSVSSICVSQ